MKMAVRAQKSNCSSLRFEPLEGRLMLSGNVKVLFDHGSLIIRGDNADNGVLISQTAGVTSVVGDATTLINGGTGTFAGTVTRDIKLEMKKGNDTVQIDTVSVPRDLIIDLNGGDNGVVLTAVDVGRNLNVEGDNGADMMRLNFQTGGDAKINAGKGTNLINIDTSFVQKNLNLDTNKGVDLVGIINTEVDKNANIDTGAGDDMVVVLGLLVKNQLSINSHSGNDEVLATLDTATILAELNPTGTGFVANHAALSIFAAAIRLKMTEVADAEVPGSFLATKAKIITEAGDDVALITDASVNDLTVTLGRGNDFLGYTGNTVTKATLDGDSGTDTLDSGGVFHANQKKGNPKIINFEVFPAAAT
jgi:hypothetical protein